MSKAAEKRLAHWLQLPDTEPLDPQRTGAGGGETARFTLEEFFARAGIQRPPPQLTADTEELPGAPAGPKVPEPS